eukprot:TRINITY_DN4133_c0_g1_i1.p1 TRINITY_DN4133_c0_g1~~TRINITY_DN4133_c0_g1_i1.p1  ORF type:complete len:971 (-),score=232.26 TRINITY_DN4133_c0_g1_i1:69-2948(-)
MSSHLLTLFCCCAVLLAHAAKVDPVQNNKSKSLPSSERAFQVLLKTKSFDVRSDTPVHTVPQHLAEASDHHLYVIHATPLFENFSDEFANRLWDVFQTKLYGPVPFNSFFVYASQGAIEFIKSHEKYFDWVSFVDPEWRTDFGLRSPQKVELSEEEAKETKLLTSMLVSLVPTLEYAEKEFQNLAGKLQKDLQGVLGATEEVSVKYEGEQMLKVVTPDEDSVVKAAKFLSNVPFVQFVERSIHFVPRLKWVKPFVFNGIKATKYNVDGYYNGTYSDLFVPYSIALTGLNQVIGIADTGMKSPSHCFFYSFVEATTPISCTSWNGGNVSSVTTLSHPRIKQYYGYGHSAVNDGNGHGTLIASIIAANPPYSTFSEANQYTGIAYQAKLSIIDLMESSSFNVPTSLQGMFQVSYLAGARVFCNSFSGYDPTVTTISGYNPSSSYSSQTKDIDQFMYNNPDMLIVVPAGFSTCVSSTSTLGNLGWSKNALVVGASMNVDGAFSYLRDKLQAGGGLPLDQANSSGFVTNTLKSPYSLSNKSPAPTFADGRLKPDIYAPGTYVIGANWQSYSDSYCNNAFNPFGILADLYIDKQAHGPSIATAVVSGMAALVRQYLMEGYQVTGDSSTTNSFANPSAAVVKALIINGAVPVPSSDSELAGQFAYDTSTTCPLYNTLTSNLQTGFGYAQLSTSLLQKSSKFKLYFPGHDETSNSTLGDPQIPQATTLSYSYCAFYDADHLFQTNITLAWMDPVSSSGASMTLLNDLNLKVTYGSTTYWGNGKTNGDTVNTVERVQLPVLTSGTRNIVINVIAADSLSYGKQNFALVVSGWVSSGDCSVALTPDGQNQSVSSTSQTTTTTSSTSWLSSVLSDTASYATAIIILITLILVFCVCCCIGVFYCLAFVYSPMRRKAKATGAAGGIEEGRKSTPAPAPPTPAPAPAPAPVDAEVPVRPSGIPEGDASTQI